MADKNQNKETKVKPPAQSVKIVAEMPEDEEMRENLQELKENDGYPGSCGV